MYVPTLWRKGTTFLFCEILGLAQDLLEKQDNVNTIPGAKSRHLTRKPLDKGFENGWVLCPGSTVSMFAIYRNGGDEQTS